MKDLLSANRILSSLDSKPLSSLLTESLTVAKRNKITHFESCIKLELNGYYDTNPELKEETIVPEYRAVPGQYCDRYGRPLIIKDPNLQFIQESRLRNIVPELEKLAIEEKVLRLLILMANHQVYAGTKMITMFFMLGPLLRPII